MKRLAWLVGGLASLVGGFLSVLGVSVWLGGPTAPTVPMSSISSAFGSADYSGMPAVRSYTARDGVRLVYRLYEPSASSSRPPMAALVLVHGSSATSESMHPLAVSLAAAGHAVYALDVRGHGGSGPKGTLSYVGQLDDDLEDFVEAVRPPQPRALMGFSSGGGFALRIASGPQAKSFQGYVLLSPFLNQDASTQREDSGGWVSIGVPRLVALQVLTGLGITRLNNLPVLRFAIHPSNASLLTASYDFNLQDNFRPRMDYQHDIQSVSQPVVVMAGTKDEAFYADRFAQEFAQSPGLVGVELIDGADHAGLILQPTALRAIGHAVYRLGKAPDG